MNPPMNEVILSQKTPEGKTLQATFLPDKGMNLVGFKLDELELIDQSTRTLFEERFAGLGALIGPHFHRRRAEILPKIADESLFPHIARVKAKGVADPFSHGIARYAPWKATSTPTSISATINGKDTWNGVSLASLEGQNFNMTYNASLIAKGLQIELSIVSDTDSLVGLHYYYHLPQGTGKVISAIQPEYRDHKGLKPLPSAWNMSSQHVLTFDLSEEADYTFYPFPNPRGGHILLDADSYKLKISYECPSQENAWQLYHTKGASFVCVEPLSAQDPRHPNLSVSSLKVNLEIES